MLLPLSKDNPPTPFSLAYMFASLFCIIRGSVWLPILIYSQPQVILSEPMSNFIFRYLHSSPLIIKLREALRFPGQQNMSSLGNQLLIHSAHWGKSLRSDGEMPVAHGTQMLSLSRPLPWAWSLVCSEEARIHHDPTERQVGSGPVLNTTLGGMCWTGTKPESDWDHIPSISSPPLLTRKS